MEHETNKSGDCCCCAARIFIVNKKVDSTEPNSKGENEIKKKTNMVSTVISKLGSWVIDENTDFYRIVIIQFTK